MKVTITSATELTSSQVADIKTAVDKKHGKGNSYELELNPAVLGGVKIRIGSKVLDRTVRSRLNQLKEELQQL